MPLREGLKPPLIGTGVSLVPVVPHWDRRMREPHGTPCSSSTVEPRVSSPYDPIATASGPLIGSGSAGADE